MDKVKILIIDDEKIAAIAFQRELELAGYDVKVALYGKEAIEFVRREHFDIVYTDLVMPEINGVMVCEEIKSISPRTEVVLISGHPDEIQQYAMAFLNAGGKDRIIRKPLFKDELTEVTEEILKKLGRNRDENT